MEKLYEDDNIVVSIIKKDSPYVTLAMASADLRFHGMDLPQAEFINSSKTATAIFIVDKKISWANSIDFSLLQKIINPYLAGRTVNTLGSSMGGFNAIVASNFFKINVAVAFVPQYSVCPEVMPNDSRWYCFAKDIHTWHYKSLENQFNSTTQYYILAGTNGGDIVQLRRMPIQPNIQKIYFNNKLFHHDTARMLKVDNLLYDVVNACFTCISADNIIKQYLSNPMYEAYSPKGEI